MLCGYQAADAVTTNRRMAPQFHESGPCASCDGPVRRTTVPAGTSRPRQGVAIAVARVDFAARPGDDGTYRPGPCRREGGPLNLTRLVRSRQLEPKNAKSGLVARPSNWPPRCS